MPRHYIPVSREVFLKAVQSTFDARDQFKTDRFKRDLQKVDFDTENTTGFTDTRGFGDYPVGYLEITPGFHTFFVNAGGDWEYPICFILYWSPSGLRAYIPNRGNVYNKAQKCAYGSEDTEEEYEDDVVAKEYNYDSLVSDITNRIKLR